MRARAAYAYAVLALLSLVLAGVAMLFAANDVTSNDHKFCEVVNGVTAIPVATPADPRANPSRETAYEWYLRFVRLDRSLGC